MHFIITMLNVSQSVKISYTQSLGLCCLVAYLGGGGTGLENNLLDVTLVIYNFICLLGTIVTTKVTYKTMITEKK